MIRDKAGNGLRRAARVALVGLVGLGATGCTDWALYDLDVFWGRFAVFGMMRGSVSYDPYELPRLPAEGTVPVSGPGGHEILPTFTQLQLDSVGAVLTNPLPASSEVLELGRQVYDVQCAVCHGPQGAGNGTVVGPGKYPTAPAINTEVSAARSDGYVYGVIRVGRGLMPSYGEKVNHTERWAVAHYLRVLQGGGGITVEEAAAANPGVPTVVNPSDSVVPAPAPASGVADTAQAR